MNLVLISTVVIKANFIFEKNKKARITACFYA